VIIGIVGIVGISSLVACAGKQSPMRESDMQDGAPAQAAEAPVDEAYRDGLEEEEAPAEDAFDELASIRAELDRYEAQLWQVGVPVGAYARRPELEDAADRPGDVASEPSPAKEESKKPSRSRPAAKSTGRTSGAKAGKKKKKARGGLDYSRTDEGLAKNVDGSAERCETVCELASAICELETRICDMAPRHPEDPRYQAACERATDDCRTASEACQQCSSG
jgi:hypothetical protein